MPMSSLILTPEHVLAALRLWQGGNPERWPLAHLRLWAQAALTRDHHATLAETGPAAQNRAVLELGLQEVHRFHPETSELLRARFEHRQEMLLLANRQNVTEQGILYRQRQAVRSLTDALLRLETAASERWQARAFSHLAPPSYHKLIGVDTFQARLQDALLAERHHFMAAATGIGGIGKTALADQVVRHLIQTTRFTEIAWVTAKQTHLSAMGRLQVDSGRAALTLPMLWEELATQFGLEATAVTSQLQRQRTVQRYIRDCPCLVVIDNLETVTDYRTLIPELQQWKNPTKFLLTSRISLLDRPDVFSVGLQELPAVAAFELIRSEAEYSGFQELAAVDDRALQQIYDAVGGNPLALKLIIGQLRFYSLSRVLARFSAYSGGPTAGHTGGHAGGSEGLFDYIFSEIWETLSDSSKESLLGLTHAGASGFTLEHLVTFTGIDEMIAAAALPELVMLSLVEVAGNLTERRYRLHRLTELFLRGMFEPGDQS
jgi:hypothetical protein